LYILLARSNSGTGIFRNADELDGGHTTEEDILPQSPDLVRKQVYSGDEMTMRFLKAGLSVYFQSWH